VRRKSFPVVLSIVSLVMLMAAATWTEAARAAARKSAPASRPAAAPALTGADALRADLERILAETGLPKTSVSARVLVLPEASGRIPAEALWAVRADAPMVPASTMKLVTTAACFDRFGPEWRIRTSIGRLPAAAGFARAEPALGGAKPGGQAKWDLAVIGGGDPNFSGRFFGRDPVGAFRRWADVLKARGVTAVGRIVLDDTLFDDVLQHPHWPPDQRAEWYEAPVSALSLNDNCVDIHVTPGKVGEPATVRLEPAGGYVAVDGTILTVADRKDHAFSIERIPEAAAGAAMRLKVSGRFWVQAPEAVEYRTVVNPTMFFGAALAETLRDEGIAVAGPIARERIEDKGGKARPDFLCDVIHATRLDQTVAVANKRSQGLYAECLLKILGAFGPQARKSAASESVKDEIRLPPDQGSWPAGAAEAMRWMAERGIPTDGCVMDDGSGLSKENRLTAIAVTELLSVMYQRHGDAFVETLSVAGQDGSLAKRLQNTPADGRVFGKTGYVFGTSALSGYVRTRSGRTIAFSLIMNDVPWGELWKARLAQDKACLRLVDY